MAILRNGLLGGITGKLGNTVCYMLNGKQVVRMIVKSDKPPTQKQLDNWAEMALVNAFLKPLVELIKVGYGPEAKIRNLSEYNVAVSYIKKHALKGERPNREIDYTRVMLSRGGLRELRFPEAVIDDNVLIVSWKPDTHWHQSSSPNDRVMVVACLPAGPDGVPRACFRLCGVERSTGQYVLQLHEELAGRPVEIFAFVLSADGKMVSDSQYLGRLG